MTIISTLIAVGTIFIFACVPAFIIVGILWLIKSRKMKKQIPGNIQEIINKDKEDQEQIENATKEERIQRDKEIIRGESFDSQTSEGERETKGREPDIERGDQGTESEEQIQKPERVQIPEADSRRKKKRTVKLHKPTTL